MTLSDDEFSDVITAPDISVAAPSPNLSLTLTRLVNVANEEIAQILSELVPDDDQHPLRVLMAADGPARQMDYFAVERWLRSQNNWSASFLIAFEKKVRGIVAAASPELGHLASADSRSNSGSGLGLAGLSLVDEAEMTESISIANLTRKGDAATSEQLGPLLLRLNALVGSEVFTEHANPFSPTVIAEVLQSTLKEFGDAVGMPLRMILYKLLERMLMAELGAVYSRINAELAAMGLLPDLKVKPIVRVARSAKSPQRPAAAEQAESPAQEAKRENPPPTKVAADGRALDAGAAEVFSTLQQLLSLQRQTTPAATAPATAWTDEQGQPLPRGSYAPQNLLGALSTLQSSLDALAVNAQGAFDPAQFKEKVNARLAKGEDGSPHSTLSQIDEDTIDIVSTLFEFILDDPSLAEPMKALLGRLQIPVLKVAIVDRSFFGNKNHVARRLLNELAQAGSGWSADGNYKEDPVYVKVFGVVTRILDEFTNDVSIFSQLLDEFLAFTAEQGQQQDAFVNKVEEQRKQVQAIVDENLKPQPVPEDVATFVRAAWSEVLTKTLSEHGAPSEQWDGAVEALRSLVWSVQPKTEVTEKRLMAMMVPQLLETLEAGLEKIGFPKEKRNDFYTTLQGIHLICLRGKSPMTAPKPAATTARDAAKPAAEPVAADPLIDAALTQLNAIPLGTWIELTGEEAKKKRGKLVWRDDFFKELTFVDWRFKVVLDEKLDKLAQRIVAGTMRILADAPLLDRAISALLNKMKALTTPQSRE